ncbi:hypothetical protein ACFRMQ_09655 [Kitasatospora sp. NPDC056783]|uniref:hypothetical protein n=1 Tax=Kitasatospora sp. NPDC056783 TaxID=3345943 RepID=UPI0036A49C1B
MTTPGQTPPPPPYYPGQSPAGPTQPWRKKIPPIGWVAAGISLVVLIGGGAAIIRNATQNSGCWLVSDGNSLSIQVAGSGAEQACADLMSPMTDYGSTTWGHGDGEPADKGSATCRLLKPDAQATVWDSSGNPIVGNGLCSFLLGFGWEQPPN